MSELVHKPIVILGAGGHCRSVIDVLRAADRPIMGILDRPESTRGEVDGVPLIGSDGDIPRLIATGSEFLIGLGDMGLPIKRLRLFDLLERQRAALATVVSPEAYASSRATLSAGVVVMHRAIVSAGAYVGENAVVNTAAVIEHDVRLEAHVQVGPGALINGNAHIGERSYVGSGAIIREGIAIAPGIVVGMGAVVVTDLDKAGVYVGNPARWIKANPQ